MTLTEPPLQLDSASAEPGEEMLFGSAAAFRIAQRDCDVLIVEGDQECAKTLEHTLRCGGFSVRSASCARELLSLVRAVRPGLILMEWRMPDLDGPAFTVRLKQKPELQHIQVLAMTAYWRYYDRAHALRAGCDGFLSKPIPAKQLLDEVVRLLAVGSSLSRFRSLSRLIN